MKRIILLLVAILSFISNAWADVCYDVKKDIADKAVAIIKNQKILYSYCSICPEAEVLQIKVKNVQNSNPIRVNGKEIDLAHIYYKKGKKYINLGIQSGCIENGQYNISEDLEILAPIHRSPEIDENKIKSKTKKIFDACYSAYGKVSAQTTHDMMEQNEKINACLTEAIYKEIKKGFNAEQQDKMKRDIKQLQKSTLNFYYGLYAENKYCENACGTMANILPYIDEGKLLMDVLERLIFLNTVKNGY